MKRVATGGSTRSLASDLDPEEWKVRRWKAGALRLITILAPILVSASVVFLLDRSLRPSALGWRVLWIAFLFVVAVFISKGVEHLSRGLIPIERLYRMSLAFPDKAPDRFKLAMRRDTARSLQRDLLGGQLSQPEHAEKLLQLVAKLSKHDRGTRGHSERVQAYSDVIGEELDLTAQERQKLHWAALTHDLGKLEVPSEILNSPDKPSDEEWQVLRSHPGAGAAYVKPLEPWLGDWILATSEHHERFDGGGYPLGLAGNDISLSGRIVAVADAYDVMTSRRSYKAPLSAEAARAELTRNSGTQFDPTIVRAFLNAGVDFSASRYGPLATLQALLPQAGAVAATAGSAAVVASASLVGTVAPGGFTGSAEWATDEIPEVVITDRRTNDLTPESTVVVAGAGEDSPDPEGGEPGIEAGDRTPRQPAEPDTTDPPVSVPAETVPEQLAATAPTTTAPDEPPTEPTTTATEDRLVGSGAQQPTPANLDADGTRQPANLPTVTTTPPTTARAPKPPATTSPTTVPLPRTAPTTTAAPVRGTTQNNQVFSLSKEAEETAPPANVSKGNPELQTGSTSWVFLEATNVVAPAEGLVVNKTQTGLYNGNDLAENFTLAPGTTFCSYFVHADSPTTEVERLVGQFTTKHRVLGVIHGPAELDASEWLENPSTFYPDFGERHLGMNDILAMNDNEVYWDLQIWSGDIDQMRIITDRC